MSGSAPDSGIIERRWASDDETIQMMSVAAARKALDRAGIEAGQIDTVIVSTVTHLYQTPAVATTIASELQEPKRRGFRHLSGLRWVLLRHRDGRLLHSQWRLEVCVDHRRRAAHRHDQPVRPIHGLPVRRRCRRRGDRPEVIPGIGLVVWGSDGDQAPLIPQTEPWDAALAWDTESYRSTKGEASWPTLKMEGNPVFKWASYTMARTPLRRSTPPAYVQRTWIVFAPHQANMRITDAMFRALKLPSRRRRTRYCPAGQHLRRIDSTGHRGVAGVRRGPQRADLPHQASAPASMPVR